MIRGGNTVNWNGPGQCSIEDCVQPPEDNLNLWPMNGANVYTLNSCTTATTNIMVSTEETASIEEITLIGEAVFKSKYQGVGLWSSS